MTANKPDETAGEMMTDSAQSTMSRLLRFLDQIEEAKIAYRLEHVRDSIMVVAAVPGARWEIEFMDDGEVEIERFTSSGVSADQTLLESLLATHGVSTYDTTATAANGVAIVS